YARLYQEHLHSGASVSIATYKRKVNIEFGVLVSDERGILSDYIEKPTYSYEVSMGVYAISKTVLRYIPKNEYFDFPMLIKTLIANRERVRASPFDGIWLDIGQPADYENAQKTFTSLRDRLLPE